MGGYGSGRTGGGPTVEDGLTLGLGRLIRQGNVLPRNHVSGTLTWTNTRTGEHVASIGYEACLLDPDRSWMRLYYTAISRRDGSKVAIDDRVRLETTRPRFGGLRWWFICPLTGRRAAKLHLPNGATRFACRQTYRLAYRSQRESGLGRTHAWQARLCRKLGTDYRFSLDFAPPRPKWMRHKSYARLEAEVEAAIAAHEAVFAAGAYGSSREPSGWAVAAGSAVSPESSGATREAGHATTDADHRCALALRAGMD